MPVEIKELQINVTVNQPGAASPAESAQAGKAGGGEDAKNLVNQCIEQVMEIINNKKER